MSDGSSLTYLYNINEHTDIHYLNNMVHMNKTHELDRLQFDLHAAKILKLNIQRILSYIWILIFELFTLVIYSCVDLGYVKLYKCVMRQCSQYRDYLQCIFMRHWILKHQSSFFCLWSTGNILYTECMMIQNDSKPVRKVHTWNRGVQF